MDPLPPEAKTDRFIVRLPDGTFLKYQSYSTPRRSCNFSEAVTCDQATEFETEDQALRAICNARILQSDRRGATVHRIPKPADA